MDIIFGVDRLFGEGPAAEVAEPGHRGIDMPAVLALDRFQALLFDRLTGFILGDAVGPENLIINVGPGKVSIGLEHVRIETSPHHQLDHALGYALFDQMGNPRVPEDVRGDMLCNAGPPCDPLQLQVYRGMGEWSGVIGDEYRHLIRNRSEGVIVLPGGNVFPGHHEPDISGFVCLEVHVHDHSPLIEGQVPPFHHANLTDSKAALVEHHDNRSVNAPDTGVHHLGYLVGGQEVGCGLRHGLMVWGYEIAEFLFRDAGIAILDEPEVKLFDNDEVIDNGVFHELCATFTGPVFQGCNSRIKRRHIVLIKRSDKTTPANQRVGQVMGPFDAGIT